MLGKPCSRTVGRSGSASVRFGESVASARSAPPRTCASEVEIWSPPNWMRPDRSSCTSGAAPRNGTWSILMPLSRFKVSPERCITLPGPVEP